MYPPVSFKRVVINKAHNVILERGVIPDLPQGEFPAITGTGN